MTKGTFIAGQALRPTELKVADYYGKYIDDMIKRGDAKKAAQAKALQEEKNRIGERFKDIKIDPYATIANLQDFANQQMVETAKYIGTQRVLAENDLANSHVYMQRAENAWNDYRTMSSSFGNKDFIEKANAKQQALANNDVFGDTDNNERLRMLGTIIPNVKRNEDGRITFYMPQNANATDDDELQAYSAGQIISHWTTPDEINMLRSNKSNGNNGFLDKQSYELAKTMADEYSKNYDGNITNGKKWFSETRGNQWFDSTFGQYNPNNVPTIVSQYSKAILGKEINSPEDFAAAKQGIINHVASLVPETIKRDTDKMGVEVAILNERLKGEKLDNAQKAYNLANPGSYSRGGGSGGGGSSGGGNNENVIINGSTIMRVKNKNGQYGYYQQEGLMMRGQAGKGDNAETVFIQPFWNPNANGKKGGVYYGIAKPTEGGGYTMESLGGKMNGDAAGIQEARKYLSQSDFNKLAKEAAMYYSNPALRKAGQYLKEVDRRFTEVDFSEIGGSSGKKVTRVR